MKLKKLLIVFFVLIFSFTIVGCKNDNGQNPSTANPTTPSNGNGENSPIVDPENPIGTGNEDDKTQNVLTTKQIIDDMIGIFQETTSTDFDFFDAYIEKNGKKIGGIAFTNFSEGYKSVVTDEVYFASGFIRYDNVALTENDINNGIIIKTDDERYNNTEYIYAYPTFKGINDANLNEDNSASNVIPTHYIHQGNYIKWDIKDDKLIFSATPYLGANTKEIDDSKGNIYNYDKNEYAYITDNLPFVPISGTALSNKNYTKSVLTMLDDILNNQNINFTSEELKTYIGTASDAIKEAIHNSKLLSTQKEKFLGYDIEEIENILEKSNPYQYLRITVNEQGIQQLNLVDMDLIPSLEEKILTTVISVTGYALGVALKIIPGVNVFGTILGGAIMNACQTAFEHVVVFNNPIDSGFWLKVGVASAIGAVSSCLCDAIDSFESKIVKKIIGSIIDPSADVFSAWINSSIDGKEFNALEATFTGLTSLTRQVICSAVTTKVFHQSKKNIKLEMFQIKNSKYVYLNNENLDYIVKKVDRNEKIYNNLLNDYLKELKTVIEADTDKAQFVFY